MSFNFAGKKVLVTGAGRGIGRGIATTLAQTGCKVYALDINQQSLDSLLKEFPSISTINLDISKWDETKKELEKLEVLDGLVNNAAVVHVASALETTKGDLDRILSTNLLAAINITQVIAKKMLDEKKQGSIVNISSVVALQAYPSVLAYSIAKAGLDMVTKQFALELGPHNIRVNSVNPGIVATELLKPVLAAGHPLDKLVQERCPIQKMAEVSNITGPVLYLLSDQSAMVTGTQHFVDGGMTCQITLKS